MFKKILIHLFMIFSVFAFFSQNKLIIEKITFENLKRTDPQYILNQISLKVGDEWDEEKKEAVISKLSEMKKLFEEVSVTEKITENQKVEVIIKLLEKSAFLVIPYLSYSNSRGLIPKLAFRYFNLGGYSKYLKSKLEFVPTESLNFNLRYDDPAVLEKENMHYYIDSWFRTSVINYYANVNFINNNPSNTTIKGIRPIGSFGSDGSERWNKDLFYETETTFQYNFIHPVFNYEFQPKFNFYYRRVPERVDDDNNFLSDDIVQQTVIRPKFEFLTTFPITGTWVTMQPKFIASYEHYYGKDNFMNKDAAWDIIKKRAGVEYYSGYRNFYSEGILKLEQDLALPVLIKPVAATLTPYVNLVYQKNNSYAHKTYTEYLMMDYYDQNFSIRQNLRDSIDYFIGLKFEKSMDLRNTSHKFLVQAEFSQRVFGHWAVKSLVNDGKVDRYDFDHDGILEVSERLYNRKYDTKTSYYLYYPRFNFKFSYWLDVRFLQNHVFKFRSMLFAKFNDKSEWDSYVLTDDADDLTPGRVKGWAGLFIKLKYEIPLFDFSSPRWLTKSVKRPLKWGIFWDLFMDIGIAQNNEPDIIWEKYDHEDRDNYFRKKYISKYPGLTDDDYSKMGSVYKIKTSYTLDKNNLHLYPALALGTSVRILPKFVPIEVRITIAGSLWQIIRDKEITGKSVILEFSIDDAF